MGNLSSKGKKSSKRNRHDESSQHGQLPHHSSRVPLETNLLPKENMCGQSTGDSQEDEQCKIRAQGRSNQSIRESSSSEHLYESLDESSELSEDERYNRRLGFHSDEESWTVGKLLSKLSYEYFNICLDLSTCSLTSIPESLLHIPSKSAITKVSLAYNNLSCIPHELYLLENLNHLIVNKNPIKSISDNICLLQALKRLDARTCQLEHISEGIQNCKYLKTLDLSENTCLSIFPTSICKCQNLETLIVAGCGIKELPKTVGLVKKLETNTLSYLGLTKVPLQSMHCPSLSTISLSNNYITHIPPEIGICSSLGSLFLNTNNISDLPHEIVQCTNLVELNLHNNKFSIIPTPVYDLVNLRLLRMENNRITHIEPDIGKLKNLIRLNLRDNKIWTLPMELINCERLSFLDVFGNPLDIPNTILSSGTEGILVYLRDIAVSKEVQQTRRNLMVIGDTEAGKTSFIQSILKGRAQPTSIADRTHVLVKYGWQPQTDIKEDAKLDINIYDFGGHPCYGATTTLYLNENSLFLVTFDMSRHGNTNFIRNIHLWLQLITCRIPGATVQLLGTHSDEVDASCHVSILQCVATHLIKEERIVVEQLKRDLDTVSTHLQTCNTSTEQENFRKQSHRLQFMIQTRPALLDELAAVSNTNYEGIDEVLANIVCTLGDKNIFPTIVIPSSWQALHEKICAAVGSVCDHWLTMDEVRDLCVPLGLDETSLDVTLRYLHLCGDILWFSEFEPLKNIIFHHPDDLTQILKTIISHDLEYLIDNDNASFIHLTQSETRKMKYNLKNTGTLAMETVRCILSSLGCSENIFPVLIKLLVNFDIGFLVPETANLSDIKSILGIRIPWFLEHSKPDSIPWEAKPIDEYQVTIKIVCRRWCPPNLFQTIAVRLNKHVTQRTDWKNGVYATKEANRLLLELQDEGSQEIIFVCVRSKKVLGIWMFIRPVLKGIQYSLDQWPGLVYSREVVCPLCITEGVDEPGIFADLWLDELCQEQYLHCLKHSRGEPIPAAHVYPPIEAFDELVGRYTKEQAQFARYNLLVTGCGTERMRDVFLKYLQNLNLSLDDWLQANQETIRQKTRGPVKYMYRKLYPSTDDPVKLENLDITILKFLFTKILEDFDPPQKGWFEDPEDTDLSTGADILRIGKLRNEPYLAHNPKCELSERDFEIKWTEAEAVILRLHGDKREITKIKVGQID